MLVLGMPNVLIDNNVLSKIKKKESDYQKFYGQMIKLCGWSSTKSPYVHLTPFGVLEFLRRSWKRDQSIQYDAGVVQDAEALLRQGLLNEANDLIDTLQINTYQRHLEYFRNRSDLTKRSLQDQLSIELSYTGSFAKNFFESIFEDKVSEDQKMELMYNHLAFEAVCETAQPASIRRFLCQKMIVTFFKALEEGRNMSILRALGRILDDFSTIVETTEENQLREKNYLGESLSKSQLLANLELLKDYGGLDEEKDLLDSELIHFSLFGLVINGDCQKIDCVTLGV